MINVHVLAGGDSPERDVSLRSGVAVTAALWQAGYTVTQLDTSVATIDEIVACDVVFPVLHGVGGEDGTIQAELERRGVTFVGSGSEASQLCMDKHAYKQRIAAHGLPTAASALVGTRTFKEHELSKEPFVLKPSAGGSSVDTFIVRDVTAAPWTEIEVTLKRYGDMLLEQLIDGTELTVGVLGSEALPAIEIIPPSDGEFDYENKYNGKTQELCPPQNVSAKIQVAAQDLAVQAHAVTGCRDFSRTDMIVDNAGRLWLLETNTIPGMTDQSLFPKMAAAKGLSMPELCDELVQLSCSRSEAE